MCGLEADERTSVHFDEAVLEVTRASLIRDDVGSAKNSSESGNWSILLEESEIGGVDRNEMLAERGRVQ